MLLCIHGLGSSTGEWLPHLRNIIRTPDQYTGHKLLEATTLPLPGHFCDDDSFGWESMRRAIHTFMEEQRDPQIALHSLLLNHKQNDVFERLESEKLTIIGAELGGAIALNFALANPELVEEIILVDCGSSFTVMSKAQRAFSRYSTWKLPPDKLQQKIQQSNQPAYEKNMFSILLEGGERKGLKSAHYLMDTYSFKDFFKQSSLEHQLAFSQIRICSINGSLNSHCPPRKALEIEHIISSKNPFFSSQQAALTLGRIPTVATTQITYRNTSNNAHHKNPEQFANDVIKFLENNQRSYFMS